MKNHKKYLSRDYYIKPILRLVFFLSEVIVSIYIILDLFVHINYDKAIADITTLILLFITHIFFLKSKKFHQVAVYLTLIIIMSTNITLYLIGLKDLELVWLFMVPILAFLLTDIKMSLVLMSLHIAVISTIYYFKSSSWALEVVTIDVWLNIVTAIIVLSIFLFIYEKIRAQMMTIIEHSFEREEVQKRELQRLNSELNIYQETLEIRVEEGITKQQRTQDLLTQQTKMAALGEMLASVGHQWKQPLSVISADTASIEISTQMGTLSNEEVESHSKVVKEQIVYMTQTLQSFSDFFKPNKQKETFCIEESIQAILRLFSHTYSSQNITVNIDLQNCVEISSYKNEFRQVLLNILNNAKDVIVDKSPKNRDVDITIYKKEGFVYCEVQDHAGGVDESIISTIFDSLVTSKSKENGTGLGLYMSKLIITSSMHGKLDVENRDDGACFIISLPLSF